MSSAYANAGMSVAIVDADLVGRSLTPQLISPELDGVLQWLRKQDVTAEPPVHSTPIPGVYMVPHGRDNGLEPESLGPKHMRAMLDLLKSRFDVVLVDSGPILGSTEAAAAATVCDETVLVIGRGQRESLVKAARDRLERLGTRRVGLVFNRADREDLERHPTSAASTSMSKRSRVSGGAPQSLALSLAMQVSSDRGA
jgi:Mrp family chromosome partitioning ATPase